MPTIDANGVTFHYLQAGQGPDLFLLHGLSGNLATWHLRIVPLLQEHFRVTTYDLRGHGRSSMPPSGYTTGDMAGDLNALMDALGIARAAFVGHSFGADIVLHFALLHPNRASRLALIEPGIPALVHDRKLGQWEGWEFWARDLERMTGEPVPRERWSDVAYMVRRSVEIPIVYGPLKGLPRRKDRILKLLDTTTMIADYETVGELTLQNLATIQHPKLLIYDGGSAWLSSFRVLRDLLVNCTPIVLPGAEMRHFAPLEAPELLVEHLVRFLGVDQNGGGATVQPSQVGVSLA
ncbi:MAG TPA: alpha/beta hydrolase [Planctomycetaceae bacterium]|nr:alpha/beta hydrolase [Planctomycetaceae bacterium]